MAAQEARAAPPAAPTPLPALAPAPASAAAPPPRVPFGTGPKERIEGLYEDPASKPALEARIAMIKPNGNDPPEAERRVSIFVGISDPEKANPFNEAAQVEIFEVLKEFDGRWEPIWVAGGRLPAGWAKVPVSKARDAARAIKAKGYKIA